MEAIFNALVEQGFKIFGGAVLSRLTRKPINDIDILIEGEKHLWTNARKIALMLVSDFGCRKVDIDRISDNFEYIFVTYGSLRIDFQLEDGTRKNIDLICINDGMGYNIDFDINSLYIADGKLGTLLAVKQKEKSYHSTGGDILPAETDTEQIAQILHHIKHRVCVQVKFDIPDCPPESSECTCTESAPLIRRQKKIKKKGFQIISQNKLPFDPAKHLYWPGTKDIKMMSFEEILAKAVKSPRLHILPLLTNVTVSGFDAVILKLTGRLRKYAIVSGDIAQQAITAFDTTIRADTLYYPGGSVQFVPPSVEKVVLDFLQYKDDKFISISDQYSLESLEEHIREAKIQRLDMEEWITGSLYKWIGFDFTYRRR